MTLEELLGQRKIKGRTIETKDPNGFIFRGKIKGAEKWDFGKVRFSLTDVIRRFNNPESTWRHLPDFDLVVPAGTTIEPGVDGNITFPLPEGGRANIMSKGEKQPEEKDG